MLSLEDLRTKIDAALRKKFPPDPQGGYGWWVMETFPGYVVAQGPEGKLFRLEYAVGIDEEITLGDPQEVETVYVPVEASAAFVAGEAGTPQNDGYTWPVEVIRAGPGHAHLTLGDGQAAALPQLITPEFVGQIAAAVENVRFGRRHPRDEADIQNPERIAGWFSAGQVVGDAARANLHLLKSEKAMRDTLLATREAEKMDLFQLSILAYAAYEPETRNGQDWLVPKKLGKLLTIDLVTEAAYGGRFLMAATSASWLKEMADLQRQAIKIPPSRRAGGEKNPRLAGGIQGGAMKDKIVKVLAALRQHDPGRTQELDTEFAALAESEHPNFLAKITEALIEASAKPAAAPAAPAKPDPPAPKPEEILLRAEKLHSQVLVDEKLRDSKLPEPAAKLVRERFEGSVAAAAQIDAEITRVRAAFAAFSNVGRISAEGGIIVGRESRDKVQLALDAMLGVKEALADKSARPFRGIREAYIFCTGDHELTFSAGGFHRVSAAIATTDFPNLLLNSMTKRLLQDYAAVGMGGLERLISVIPVSDFKTQDRVRMGYLGDLPIVTEGADYLEGTKPTDEKVSYAIAKRGRLFTISEETIRNDDLGKIAAFPAREARAGARTVKQYITDFFVNNPNYDPDGAAWFNGAHSNLGSAALSATELDARNLALMKQTEKDSGKRLGLRLRWIQVPVDLEATARQINRNDEGTNNWFGKFGANDENIIVNDCLTDTNDFIYGDFPENAPFLEIAFLDGVQSVQILLQNDPRQGVTFANDQIQYKSKIAFGGDIIDYRSVGKNVVAA